MKVVVLAGGNSDEREVSLRSGAAVAAALRVANHQVTNVDPAEGIDYLLDQAKNAEVVFPALHGAGGEDGELQKILEDHQIKFVGSGSAASALCFDKIRYIGLLEANNILVPQSELVDKASYAGSSLINQPYVLKPNDGGSSIDTFIVRNPAETPNEQIQSAFERYNKLLLQPLIEGVEITMAVVGEEALPVIEIIPPLGQEFDYTNKYNGASQELCPPQHVPEEQQQIAQATALKIHHLTGCRDMSRTDIIISNDGAQYVLETNTIPGLTDQSLLPKAAQVAGYSMPELCNQLVEAAFRRG